MSDAKYAGHVPPREIPQPRPADWSMPIELMKLVTQWERRAKMQFECRDRTEDEAGKRVMAHGAMTNFNCAQQLREVLGAPLLPSSATPKEQEP